MRIQPSRNFTAEPGSVAMTDMVLNMFIFFFISFSLLYTFSPHRLARIPISPPESTSSPTHTIDQSVVVTMDHAGILYVGEDVVNLGDLQLTVRQALASTTQTTVLLRADRLVTIQEVVRVMELAKEAGAADVSIAVVKNAQPLAARSTTR
jgi:biopolymer transport protein ExbD